MPDVASPRLSRFVAALLAGLLWGIGAAALLAALTATLLTAGRGDTKAIELIMATTVWTVMAATFLGFFPIGPVAGILGWQLYRRGVVAGWAHAVAGAFSAFVAPALILWIAVDTARYPTTTNLAVLDDGMAGFLIAAFPVIGAFGGYMAARNLQRAR